MKILGLESSGKVASVAIIEDGKKIAEFTLDAGITHSQTFLPMIDNLLRQSRCDLKDIDTIAVSQGPGSYTGLRIGIATAKGFALARGIPVVPVSTLAGLAQNCVDFKGRIFAMLFARKEELYFASYQSDGIRLQEADEPQVVLLEEALAKMNEALEKGQKVAILGDGYFAFEEQINQKLRGEAFIPKPSTHQLSAVSVALLAEAHPEERISGQDLVPVYLKKTQAERECGEV